MQEELETLNFASSEINKLETEIDVSRQFSIKHVIKILSNLCREKPIVMFNVTYIAGIN